MSFSSFLQHCEGSFGSLDYLRSRHNLSFYLRECIVLSTRNQFFAWFDGKTDEEQSMLMKKAASKRDAVFDVMKKNGELEEQVMSSRKDAIRMARATKINAENTKLAELATNLEGIVPKLESEYEPMLAVYLARYPKSKEWIYLKKLLQLLKITLKDKKLPPQLFTVSENNKTLASSSLKQKLFNLI